MADTVSVTGDNRRSCVVLMFRGGKSAVDHRLCLRICTALGASNDESLFQDVQQAPASCWVTTDCLTVAHKRKLSAKCACPLAFCNFDAIDSLGEINKTFADHHASFTVLRAKRKALQSQHVCVEDLQVCAERLWKPCKYLISHFFKFLHVLVVACILAVGMSYVC